MTTLTAHRLQGARLPTWVSALAEALTARRWRGWDDRRVTDLLDRADAYEATQPSYAADLRAAAEGLDG